MSKREPPLGKGLSGVQVPYTWKFGEKTAAPEAAVEGDPSPEPPAEEDAEIARLRADIRHLKTALEDIVTFALSSADYKERAIMMHRRAVAALTRPPRPDARKTPA